MWVISHICNSYRTNNCSFWRNQSYNLCSLFILFNIIIILILLLQDAVWKLPIKVERGRKKEVDEVRNKNLGAVIEEQLQAEPRCIVQHPWVGDASVERTEDFFNTTLELKSSYSCTESFIVITCEMVAANVRTRTWCSTTY